MSIETTLESAAPVALDPTTDVECGDQYATQVDACLTALRLAAPPPRVHDPRLDQDLLDQAARLMGRATIRSGVAGGVGAAATLGGGGYMSILAAGGPGNEAGVIAILGLTFGGALGCVAGVSYSEARAHLRPRKRVRLLQRQAGGTVAKRHLDWPDELDATRNAVHVAGASLVELRALDVSDDVRAAVTEAREHLCDLVSETDRLIESGLAASMRQHDITDELEHLAATTQALLILSRERAALATEYAQRRAVTDRSRLAILTHAGGLVINENAAVRTALGELA